MVWEVNTEDMGGVQKGCGKYVEGCWRWIGRGWEVH
jgi:hypothetical protein